MIILIIIAVLSAAFIYPCFISASRADVFLEKRIAKLKKIKIERCFFVKGYNVLVKH